MHTTVRGVGAQGPCILGDPVCRPAKQRQWHRQRPPYRYDEGRMRYGSMPGTIRAL